MIQSMTGYGKAVVAYNEKKISVEVKSLNSKSLDLSVRLAPLYREKEMELRQCIAKALERGKVDFALWIEKDAGTDATPINGALVENYYRQIKDIAARTGIAEPTDWFQTLLRLPDVTTRTEVEQLSDEEWQVAMQAVYQALAQLQDFRLQEGKALMKKFTEKVDNIEKLLHSLEPYEKSRVEKIRARITDGLRTYDWPAVIRAVNTVDAVTAEVAELPFSLVQKIVKRITTEVKGVNRVLWDVTPKPSGTIEWE